ncbi:hypothetical protein F2P81_024584 [Scophthalmus maximus]|uniref:Uncharacterized protein n=1 Tax=Scophthalmus maximus TaxID=52904 RepID=A0A6A4S083_SCOMX|nr:hypothetical protein F2P81_024584 [Scophthalmus maximus]
MHRDRGARGPTGPRTCCTGTGAFVLLQAGRAASHRDEKKYEGSFHWFDFGHVHFVFINRRIKSRVLLLLVFICFSNSSSSSSSSSYFSSSSFSSSSSSSSSTPLPLRFHPSISLFLLLVSYSSR